MPEENTQVNAPVDGENAPVNAPVGGENAPVNAPVGGENAPVKDKLSLVEDNLIVFCKTPKSILEIAKHLGYKDKRSVRKRLYPLLELGKIAMTIPEKPNSRLQKYIAIK